MFRKPRYCRNHKNIQLIRVKWYLIGKTGGKKTKGWYCRLCGDKPATPV